MTDILYISGVETFPVRAVTISDGGQVVADQMIDKPEINLQQLVPGVYFIKIEVSGTDITIGFVKQ